MVEKKTDASKNIPYISFLSVLSAVGVVYMHLCGFHGMTPALSVQWVMSMCIEKIFVFAVPVFFMITGATLIDYPQKYDDWTYLKKRVCRTVIPWLAWGGISFVYFAIFNMDSTEMSSLSKIINGILNNEYRSIYWFFPVMISAYFCIPLFAYVEETKKKRVFSYLVFIGLVFNILLPDLSRILGIQIHIPIEITVVSGYLIYVLIGYLLSHCQISKKVSILIYMAAALALIMQILGTGVLSLRDGQENMLFRNSAWINCCYAVGVFALGRTYGPVFLKNRAVMNCVRFLKNYTLPIYLIHQFANNFVQKVFEYCGVVVEGTVLYQLFGPILVIVISVLVARILRQIPYLRKIVP